MRFFNIIIAAISLSLILGLACSASALDALKKNHNHSYQGYYKPGAAVALTHDYDGETRPGELENITLTLEHYYNDGYISARLLETDNLLIMSSSTLEDEKIDAMSLFQLPIQFSGTKLGEHFISLEVIHKSLSGNHSLRVLSLPIQIGSVDTSKPANTSSEKSISGTEKGLVIFNAQETIK